MSDKETGNSGPAIGRAAQDRIGRELRAMYEELLRQPLPENLIAPLRPAEPTREAAPPPDAPKPVKPTMPANRGTRHTA